MLWSFVASVEEVFQGLRGDAEVMKSNELLFEYVFMLEVVLWLLHNVVPLLVHHRLDGGGVGGLLPRTHSWGGSSIEGKILNS